jgi:hypothetical protein
MPESPTSGPRQQVRYLWFMNYTLLKNDGTLKQCSGTLLIFGGSGSEFGKVFVRVPAPFPDPDYI